MKFLFLAESMGDVQGYINNSQPVIKHPHYRHLLEDQAFFFNFLYMGCEDMRSKTLPTLDPVSLFSVLFYTPGMKLDTYGGLEASQPNPLLMALNIVETGTCRTLETLYGEDILPEMLFHWRFDVKRAPDELSGVTGAKFLTVSLVPCDAKSSKQNSFVLSDELKAKRMFCAEYLKKMRTTTTVSDGTNDTLTAQFSENPVLTALYACHLTKGNTQ